MALNLPRLQPVEQVSTNIWRILGGNPSKFTLQGTNTYLLGSGKDRILVDTAQGFEAWRENLHSALKQAGQDVKVKSCILTHWHHDHIMGIPDVRKLSPDVNVYKHLGNKYDPDKALTHEDILDIEDGQKFQVGDGSKKKDGDAAIFEVEALYAPGHAKDHMCLLVTNSSDAEEVGCIFTADNVLGHGTAVFEDLAQYIDSLNLMKKRTGQNRRAFPGHGAVIDDAQAKLDEYILHRQMREDEAMNVLIYGATKPPASEEISSSSLQSQSNSTATTAAKAESGQDTFGKEWDSMEMVKIIYSKYPENLWEPAQGGLLQVLQKLRGDGRVEETSGGRWRASGQVLKEAAAMTTKAGQHEAKGAAGKL